MGIQFYYPKPAGKGYFYHVDIYHEALLTFGEQLEKEHGERPCTSDPEDSTNYYAKDWMKNGSCSFSDKDWDKLIFRIRDYFKRHCGQVLQAESDDHRGRYIYHFGTVLGLQGKHLIRTHIFIMHSAVVEMDEEKFMNDLTKIGRW